MAVTPISTARLMGAVDDLLRNEVVELVDEARTVVRAGTRPNADLYPFTWDWDSGIVANAFGELGAVRRGVAELATLHGAQHESGLLAHIAFSNNADDLARYFPGPAVWGDLVGLDGRAISGISQPPVSGIALRALFEAGGEVDTPMLRELTRRVHAHHQWWMTNRNPARDGNVVALHGWETGRDNAPEVLELMAARDMPVRRGVAALRRDLGHGVDASSRPDDWYYERAVGIADFGVANGGWTDPALAARMPFQLADPMLGSLLAASSSDVAHVARRLGMARVAAESLEISQTVRDALRGRMLSDGRIPAIDMRSGRVMDDHVTIAQAMTSWAPGMDERTLLHNAKLVSAGGELGGEFGVLSASRANASFDAQRYWQGPSWPHMDELVARGMLRAADEPGRSPHVRMALLRAVDDLDARAARAIERHGAPEYRHAETGETVGKVGMSFSQGSVLMHARRRGNPGLDEALASWRARVELPEGASFELGGVRG